MLIAFQQKFLCKYSQPVVDKAGNLWILDQKQSQDEDNVQAIEIWIFLNMILIREFEYRCDNLPKKERRTDVFIGQNAKRIFLDVKNVDNDGPQMRLGQTRESLRSGQVETGSNYSAQRKRVKISKLYWTGDEM